MFSHIVAYLEPCVTVAYSEPRDIKNPRYIQNSVKAYSYSAVLAYSELCHIQNFCIGTQDIFNNDSYNNIKFLFFTLILHTFERNLKRHVF